MHTTCRQRTRSGISFICLSHRCSSSPSVNFFTLSVSVCRTVCPPACLSVRLVPHIPFGTFWCNFGICQKMPAGCQTRSPTSLRPRHRLLVDVSVAIRIRRLESVKSGRDSQELSSIRERTHKWQASNGDEAQSKRFPNATRSGKWKKWREIRKMLAWKWTNLPWC